MGYALYEKDGMKRGYAVSCKCHKRGCKKKIDRGMAYLCYKCTWYFCYEHLYYGVTEHTCFAGTSAQVCQKCSEDDPPDES